MSKPRFGWWGYVKDMIRRYPTANITQSEKAAVDAAIELTKRMQDGQDRIDVIDMVMWSRTRTLAGAALAIPCGYETAKRYQQQFIKSVAQNFECKGLIEKSITTKAK